MAAFFWLFVGVVVCGFVFGGAYLQSPKGKGWLGEFVVGNAAKLMLNKEYTVIDNVTIPDGQNGTTQIDHIIVSEFGVFVGEVKHYAGWIFGGEHQKKWTQKFPKKSFQFQNPLHQNYKHVKCIEAVLKDSIPGLGNGKLHSLVIFVGDFKFKSELPENVVAGIDFVKFVKSKTERLLAPDQVKQVIATIESGRLAKSKHTDKEHVQYVKEIVAKKESEEMARTQHGTGGHYKKKSYKRYKNYKKKQSDVV